MVRSNEPPYPIGQLIGNYRLIKPLGEGAYSWVYLAIHVFLNRQVAIKLLLPDLLNDKGKQNFLGEAQIIARLDDHANIVKIRDYDVPDGIPFIVMDYIAGSTLEEYLKENKCLDLKTVVPWVQRIASALQYAHNHIGIDHSRGILHRDIKPANILLREEDGKVFVSDFGIALVLKKITGTLGENPRLTNGTYSYMAPECFDGNAYPASDQYSLAVVTYECLCGVLPFQGSMGEVERQHRELISPPSLCERRPDIPSAVEYVVLKALSKDPAQRYSSVQAFAQALEQAARAPRLDVPGWWEEQLVEEQLVTIKPVTRGSGMSRRTMLFRGGMLAAIVLTSGAIYYEFSREEQSTTSTPSSLPSLLSSPPPIGTLSATYKYPDAVETVAWSPNMLYLAAGRRSGVVDVRDAKKNQVSTYNRHKGAILGLSWMADSQHILSISQEQVRVWNARTGQDLPGFPVYLDQRHRLLAASWSPVPKNEHVAICVGNEVHVVDSPLLNKGWGNGDTVYKGHKGQVDAIAWSPDGQLIASASSDMTVHVWHAATGRLYFIYQGHINSQNCSLYGVLTVGWSPDGQYIASASHEGQIHAYSALQTARIVDHPLYGYSHSNTPGASVVVRSLAWSPDSTRIASGGEDNLVKIWQFGQLSSKGIYSYPGHQAPINHVAWSPNGAFIASCSDDKTAQIWRA